MLDSIKLQLINCIAGQHQTKRFLLKIVADRKVEVRT